MGIPYDLYWTGDVGEINYYIEAYRIAKKQELERDDRVAWLNGSYTFQALILSLQRLDKRGRKDKYPSKPMLVEQLEKQQKEKSSNRILTGEELLRVQKNFETQFLAMVGKVAPKETQ